MSLFSPVDAPPLQERTLSLLRSANLPETPNSRWTEGIAWQPHPSTVGWRDRACGTLYPSGDQAAGSPALYASAGQQLYQPWLAKTDDHCSAFGYSLRQYGKRALRQLEIVTPLQAEAELWTGSVALSGGDPNNYLANAASLTNITPAGGPPSLKKAFAMLEDALATAGHGRGMIHCEPQAAPTLPTVRRVENVMLTAQDTIVIPGAGYPGTGPGNAAAAVGNTWLYATGIVDVRLGDPQLFPDPETYAYDPAQAEDDSPNNRALAEFIGAAMDRNVNQVIVRAERFVAATFDPTCHFAIQAVLDT